MGRKFLQGKQLLLWSGSKGTAFYIPTRHVAFVKKNQFFRAGYRDRAGSRVQGKAMTVRVNEEELLVRYLIVGDILQNMRQYHVVEMRQWCNALVSLLSNPVHIVSSVLM